MTSSAVSGFFTSAHQPKAQHWGQTNDLLESSDVERPMSKEHSSPKDTGRRSGSGIQKTQYAPSQLVMNSNQTSSDYIKSNPKSAAPFEPYVRSGGSEESLASGLRRAGNRWSINGAEPMIANWELAEEIGKLNIVGGTNEVDGTDGTTTPSKKAIPDVLHITETSPLETSSSDTSLDSSSPQNLDDMNLPSHTRGLSTDTLESENSARSSIRLASLKTAPFTDLTKDRPRSFSGAISDAELRRLQDIPTPSQLPESLQDRGSPSSKDAGASENKIAHSSPLSGEGVAAVSQPMYPSLAAYGQPQFMGAPTQGFNPLNPHVGGPRQDDLQVDPSIQPRQQFANGGQGLGAPFVQLPSNGVMRPGQPDNLPFRQQVRTMNMFQPAMQIAPQAAPALLPSPTNYGYPTIPNAHGHHNHLSLGSQQQMYDMMVTFDTAVTRTQQSFRQGHQHSASDPASAREAANLLLSAGMHNLPGMQFPPPPTPGLYPPMAMTPPIYPNQFFQGAAPHPQQSAYNQDMINAAMNRGPGPQFAGANGAPTTPQASHQSFAGSPSPPSTAGPNPGGPSANNRKLGLYKTELCRSWEEKGSCRYGPKCQFAHGEEEIRKVARHPKYKTEICRTFWVSGSCPYGKRCCFIHTELPQSGTPPGAPGPNGEINSATPPAPDGRARSMSTNSDPNDTQSSLLARINATREQSSGVATPTATSAMEAGGGNGGFQYGHKPMTGSLRVDTNVEAPVASKQNKSAYPTFASTQMQALSPGPVTAGPDFGRHLGMGNVNLVDVNSRVNQASTPRHAYTNSDASVASFGQPRSVSGGSTPFGMLSSSQTDSPGSANAHVHGHGHSRSGSASNWGSFSQKSHLSAVSTPYPHTPSPGNASAVEGTTWTSSELSAKWN